MYTNLQQFEEEKVKEFLANDLCDEICASHFNHPCNCGSVDFLRTAIRQAGELTVQELGKPFSAFTNPNDNIASRAQSWLSNEQPQ